MPLSQQAQLAQYCVDFNKTFALARGINFDWRPDWQTGKGGTTNIRVFAPGKVGKGGDIGTIDTRLLQAREVQATMEQYYAAVSVASMEQVTGVQDLTQALAPTVAAHIYNIERDIKEVIASAVSDVTVMQPGDNLPNIVAKMIGVINSVSLESKVNVVMSPELMSVMASLLLEKFTAPANAADSFGGRIRNWMGSDIISTMTMTGFTAASGLPATLSIAAPTGPTNLLTLSTATTVAIPKGTISINLGAINYDPIRGSLTNDMFVTNAEDMPAGSTTFPLSFTLEAGKTCSALPTAGAKAVSETSGTIYHEIYVYRKDAIAGRSGVLSGHSVGKESYTPNNGISVRRWQFSEGQQDMETVRFDALMAIAPVYPVGVGKILIPSTLV
jgi:hypothetical protein